MLAVPNHIYKRLKSNDQGLSLCELNRKVLHHLPYNSIDVHFFNDYLLGTYYVPGSVEGANSRMMNKTDKGSALMELMRGYRHNQMNTQDVFIVLSTLKKRKHNNVTEN